MDFNEEELNKILSGEGESAEKVKKILSLHDESVNGLKINRDDIKKEKEELRVKYDELKAVNTKGAEDLKSLQAQLEKNSPEEIRKAYESQKSDLEKSYKGAILERDEKIKNFESQLKEAKDTERYLKCVQAFNGAAAQFDIEPSGRNFILDTVIGRKGENFAERDLGNGMQLLNKDGKSIDGSLRDFLATEVGKKFLKNGNSGGGAGGSAGSAGKEEHVYTLEQFNALSPAEQSKAASQAGFKVV